MKIAIVGAHGVGKTTLAKELSKHLEVPLIPDVAAEAFHKGFIVNENTPPENQLWMLCRQLEYEREFNEHFIADKTLYDNVVYSRHIFEDEKLLQLIEEITFKNAQYDLFLYLPIEIEIVADGRSTDVEFQRKIDEEYISLLKKLNLPYHELRGSVKERVQKALYIITER